MFDNTRSLAGVPVVFFPSSTLLVVLFAVNFQNMSPSGNIAPKEHASVTSFPSTSSVRFVGAVPIVGAAVRRTQLLYSLPLLLSALTSLYQSKHGAVGDRTVARVRCSTEPSCV